MWKFLPPAPVVEHTPTSAQRQAMAVRPGVTVVIGGPGTGKTQTLVHAVVERLGEGARLADYAVLAGSRAAAQAIRRAIVARVGVAQDSPVVTTVHGLALGLLRQFQPADDEDWALLRAPQQEERIRDLLSHPRVAWPETVQAALGTNAFARQLRELLARIRQRSMDEEQLAELTTERQSPTLAAVADFFDEYLAVGDLEHTIDYAELIYRVRLLLHDDVGAALRDQWQGVYVDDAHDLDPAQLALLADLAHLGIPVTVFADPQQVVSGFRGATGAGLEQLLAVSPSTLLTLETSHRHGLEVGALLQEFRRGLDHHGSPFELRVGGDERGRVGVSVHPDARSEAAHVADGLRRARVEGTQWADMAVITRAGRAQLAPFARALGLLGIPVEIAADELVLADDVAVRTLLAALGAAVRGEELDDGDVEPLLLSPLVGLDAVAMRKLGRFARGEGLLACIAAAPDERPWKQAKVLAGLLADCGRMLADDAPIQDVLWKLWSTTDWPERLRRAALEGGARANQHLDAVVELFERLEKGPQHSGRAGAMTFIRGLEGEEIPADTGRESSLTGTGVQLTTAHRAKGLEWQRVWVIGVQEGRWPRATPGASLLDPERLLDGTPRTVDEHLRDERRLFYLACARAGTHLHVSAVHNDDTLPSRFLRQLGVPVQEVAGEPARPLTSAALVGALRAAAGSTESSEVLRRGAARRLAQLAAEGVRTAAPGHWWGISRPGRPAPVSATEIRLSGSALEDVLACPRRYFLHRRADAAPASDPRTTVGELVHAIAGEAQVAGWGAEEMRAALDERWPEIEFEAEWQDEAERLAVEAMVDRLANWLPDKRSRLLAVERYFSVGVEAGDKPVTLHGYADRVDLVDVDGTPHLQVFDFKTGGDKQPAQVKDDVQLGLYQLAAAEGAFDELAPGVRAVLPPALVLLRQDKGGLPKVVEQSSLQAVPELKGEELAVGPTWMHDRIVHAVEVLESGEYPATRGPACEYCHFKPGCPAFTKEHA